MKRDNNLILMMGLNETVDQSAMANSVHWYCHVLRREDGHVLRMTLEFAVEGDRKKEREKNRHIRGRLRKKA